MKSCFIQRLFLLFLPLFFSIAIKAQDSLKSHLPSDSILKSSKTIVVIHSKDSYNELVDYNTLRNYLYRWTIHDSTMVKDCRGILVRFDSIPVSDTINFFAARMSSCHEAILDDISYLMIRDSVAVIYDTKRKRFVKEVMIKKYSDVGSSGKTVAVKQVEFLKHAEIVW